MCPPLWDILVRIAGADLTIVQRRVPKSTHVGWSRVIKLHLGRFGLEIGESFGQPWDNLFKDRVGSLTWTPCEMTWGKMILLCGWGGGDDKSAGKMRCCCVLAQPQPCFRSGSPWQPAFGQGRGSAGVKYLQPSRHPDLLLSLTPWQSAPVLVCPT